MLKKLNTLSVALVGSLFLLASCADLEVENLNNPDTARALASADDVEALVGSQYLLWWNGTQKNYPGMTLSVMAGTGMSSWGNFGMNDLGSLPREAFINDASYSDRWMSATPWSNMYSAISSSIDGLVAIEAGLQLPAERLARMQAFAHFNMGASYGFIANHFDRAFLVDADTNFEDVALGNVTLELSGYEDVLAFAIKHLDIAIQLAESNSFTLDPTWIPGNTLSSAQLAQLARAYKARFIVSNARSAAERAAIDWGSIATMTESVIANATFFDNDHNAYTVQADGQFWWSRMHSLQQDPTWHRPFYFLIGRYDQSGNFAAWLDIPLVDQGSERRQFIMDNADARIQNGPHEFDEDGNLTAVPAGTDFRHFGPSPLPPARGEWKFTRYHHFRNWEMYLNGFVGPMQHMRITEIKMYRAEALLRGNTGVVNPVAVDLINETRVGRGGLDPVAVTDSWDAVFNAMRYEFFIETYATAAGLDYYNVRSHGNYRGQSYGALLPGTPIHFPIPAAELQLLNMDSYTFGGTGDGAAPAVQEAMDAGNKLDISRY